MDAYLPKPGSRWESLGLSTWQGTLPSLRTGAGGAEGVSGSRREVGGEEEVENLNGIIYKVIKILLEKKVQSG